MPQSNATPNTTRSDQQHGATARTRRSGREPPSRPGGLAACGPLVRSASATALMDRTPTAVAVATMRTMVSQGS